MSLGGVNNEGFFDVPGLGGDVCQDSYEPKLFGMHGGKFCSMCTSHGSQPFRR